MGLQVYNGEKDRVKKEQLPVSQAYVSEDIILNHTRNADEPSRNFPKQRFWQFSGTIIEGTRCFRSIRKDLVGIPYSRRELQGDEIANKPQRARQLAQRLLAGRRLARNLLVAARDLGCSVCRLAS